MEKLIRSSTNETLVPQLKVASSFADRLIGLLGANELSEQQGLLITKCNSIHTFFMRFPIDCVFLDRELRVRAVKNYIKPWRMTWPVWKAVTVVELKGGVAAALNIKVGEQLYVGH